MFHGEQMLPLRQGCSSNRRLTISIGRVNIEFINEVDTAGFYLGWRDGVGGFAVFVKEGFCLFV